MNMMDLAASLRARGVPIFTSERIDRDGEVLFMGVNDFFEADGKFEIVHQFYAPRRVTTELAAYDTYSDAFIDRLNRERVTFLMDSGNQG